MEDFDSGINTVFEDFKSYNNIFSIPYISTITIVCDINRDVLCLDTIKLHTGLNIRTKKGRKEYQSFANSITVLFDDTKAIKVFKNGKFHITGCTTVNYAHYLVNKFLSIMNWSEGTFITDTKVLTANSVLKLESKQMLSLPKFKMCLQTEDLLEIRYTPDTYQALIIKVMCPFTNRRLSILCFYTGSFIVTAVTDPIELWFCFKLLCFIMDKHLATIVI
jgi:TATA-box binding protein (TBP) (component of TFIID and TFIIIB)